MLYDGNSRRITTFLGFDTASVTHPCQRYFNGLDEFGSRVRLEREDNSNLVATVLSGNFEKVPLGLSDEQRDKWELARGLDIAFADRDVIRLSSFDGIEKLMDLGSLVSLICPTELRNKYLLNGVPREAQEQKRAEYQAKLLACLERYVF